MCKAAESQVLNIATQVESTVVSLLTETKLLSTPEGQTISTDFATLLTDVKGWKSGSPAADAEQVVQDIESALPLVPLPAPFNLLVPVALGGLATILTLLGANSPAPAIAGATEAETATAQTIHAHVLASVGEAKVEQLTGYKPSLIDKARASLGDSSIAASKYKQVWDAAVDANNLPQSLKVA